jgi:hypothetical protein
MTRIWCRAGLIPVMALAQRAGLAALTGEYVRIARQCGVNAEVKVPGIVAGMAGGADSIDDLGLLRHGAARTARHGRGHITLHLPDGWHREHVWMNLFTAACGPPSTVA